MKWLLRIVPVLLLFGALSPAFSEEKGASDIRFNRDIRPILSNACFKCHGPDQKKGGLDLQTRESALKTPRSGQPAIVPGKSMASHLLERVLTRDAKEHMPPPGKGEALTAVQVAKLRAWIDAGAPWEEHWAYAKPARPGLPPVKNAGWARNPIDQFVLARLEREGLSPQPEADRATLLRRVSLDLIGLPPTPAEVDAFLQDASPNAYEKVVDRLLASPHYGERQAHPWLDQARYADTNGYEADSRRTIWPYRDWVINAFNRDLPFDQFTIEQIAGDLLPNAATEQKTVDQKIATGFHRNTMVNTEGGTDDEEFRVAAVIDRVNTTLATWMGTTIACAQCHNHKYDPFSQKEYFQFYAFFNNTEDRGRSNAPEMPVATAEEIARRQAITDEIAKQQVLLDTPTPELAAALGKWEKSLAGQESVWLPLDVAKATGIEATLTPGKDGSILVTGPNPAKEKYQIEASTKLVGITAIRLEVLADPALPAQGPGRAGNGNFVLSELQVQAGPLGETKLKAAKLQNPVADFSQQGWPVAGAIDGKADTGWAIGGAIGKDHIAVFELKDNLGTEKGVVLRITLDQQYGDQHNIGKFRLSATTAARPVGLGTLPEPIAKILAVPAEQRTPAMQLDLAKYHRTVAAELQPTRDRIAALQKQLNEFKPTTSLVLKELPKPRESYIHIRGNHTTKGEPTSPGVPAKLHPLKTDGSPNRLALARWLVDADNPLVGRVTMNRIWAQYFGRGLVETSEDFGIQGEMPTHPELLDWLATEMIAQKWSLKALHKTIVTSATYRQSSKVTRELHGRDPYNRLFARGPRFRMDAEMVRDNALAISGLLSPKLGGPSVFPYQPDGVWLNPYSGDRWVNSTNGDQYRRGLYTFWRRTAPYASFMAFDAPSREVACERRSRTNTPLQALATLNDKAFVEPAAALARRMMQEAKATDSDRATLGFRLCVSRPPAAVELDHLLKLYRVSLEKYRKDGASAAKLADSGLGAPPKELDVAELAAWTVIANVLLNLDETVTKG